MDELQAIRVMIVDDHDMVRRGLAVFLDSVEDLLLVGEARSGEEALRLCPQFEPNVVLMDMKMPGMDGIATIQALRQQQAEVQIIALTSFKDQNLVQAALQAGAIGYLHKNVSIENLATAIRAAHRGEPWLDSEATQVLLDAMNRPQHTLGHDLTQRERETLALMVEGLSNPEIASRLSVSRSTVKTHVSNVLGKLQASNRLEAVTIALKHNLVD